MSFLLSYKLSDFTKHFSATSPYILPIVVVLLIISNIFMFFAWYHFLKTPDVLFITALGISLIYVVFEYLVNMHANALGKKKLSLYQLKIIQEALTLVVFIVLAYVIFGERLTLRHAISFALIMAAVSIAFY